MIIANNNNEIVEQNKNIKSKQTKNNIENKDENSK